MSSFKRSMCRDRGINCNILTLIRKKKIKITKNPMRKIVREAFADMRNRRTEA